MKYFSIILLGLALIPGCKPPGDSGDTDGNTTAVEKQESTKLASVVQFNIPGMS